jgi:hypothetical protein
MRRRANLGSCLLVVSLILACLLGLCAPRAQATGGQQTRSMVCNRLYCSRRDPQTGAKVYGGVFFGVHIRVTRTFYCYASKVWLYRTDLNSDVTAAYYRTAEFVTPDRFNHPWR